MKSATVKTFRLKDSMTGIWFTLKRMSKMIQDARKDPLVISTARKIAELSLAGCRGDGDAKTLRILKGIHAWGRANFEYLDDPDNVEVIQTPNRMLRALKIPVQLQKAMWDPIGKALGGKLPAPKITGDSDESTVLALSLAAAVGVRGLRIELGGHEGTIHYAWAGVSDGKKWRQIDILIDEFDKGALEKMEHLDLPL
jgi:hypothetical protein